MDYLWKTRVKVIKKNYFFRLFRQLSTFIAYFILVFICFLIRPTPFERQYENKTLICIFNLPKIDYTEITFRELVNLFK